MTALAVPDSRIPFARRMGRGLLCHTVLAALVLLIVGTYPAPLPSLIRAIASMVTR